MSSAPMRNRKPSPFQLAALRSVLETGWALGSTSPAGASRTRTVLDRKRWIAWDTQGVATGSKGARGPWILTDAGAAAMALAMGRPAVARATEAWLLRQPHTPTWHPGADLLCRHCGCKAGAHLGYNGHCPATEAWSRAKEAPRADLPDVEYDRAAEAYWTARDTYFEVRT